MTLGSSVLGRPPFSGGICRIKDLAELARRVSSRGRPSSAVTVDVSDIRRGRIVATTQTVNGRGIVVQRRRPFAVYVGEGPMKKRSTPRTFEMT